MEGLKMKDVLAIAREKNSGEIMESTTDGYPLPTLEDLLRLMEDEDSSLKKDETGTNAYTVYNVYSSGPC